MFVNLQSVAKPEAKSSTDAQPRKQSKITIIPSQPKSEKNTNSQPIPAKLRENGRQEPNSRPQLERQVRIERSRSRGDTIPLSKSENTTGNNLSAKPSQTNPKKIKILNLIHINIIKLLNLSYSNLIDNFNLIRIVDKYFKLLTSIHGKLSSNKNIKETQKFMIPLDHDKNKVFL